MRIMYLIFSLSLSIGLFIPSQHSYAVTAYDSDNNSADGSDYTPLSATSMEALVQPIALYPDMLVQVILPASTFPDQIVDAALLIKTKEDAQTIKDQAWDDSVKVVATYPGVLKMMFQELDWTTALGQAFLNQHQDLFAAIQRLRLSASDSGDLESSEQQTVTTSTVEDGTKVVVIQPTNPQVVYVPTTTVVSTGYSYSSSSALVPLATFGIGLAVGAALNNNNDNYYYGGWGAGPNYWYRNNQVDKWQDNRRAVWEDYNDRQWDKQDHRQDMASKRQDFRQEMYREGNYPNKDQRAQNRSQFNQQHPDAAKNAAQKRENYQQGQRPNQAQKDQYKQNAQNKYANASSNYATRQGAAKANAQAQMQQKRNNATSSGWSTGQANRSYSAGSSGAFSGYGSQAKTSSYSSRGAASRSTSAAGTRSVGGMSRGGGGGRRR
jgi:hypothetical protein